MTDTKKETFISAMPTDVVMQILDKITEDLATIAGYDTEDVDTIVEKIISVIHFVEDICHDTNKKTILGLIILSPNLPPKNDCK